MTQIATVDGQGNVSVQITGDGNTVLAHLPHLELTLYRTRRKIRTTAGGATWTWSAPTPARSRCSAATTSRPGVADAAGDKLFAWLKRKLDGAAAREALAGLEADPESAGDRLTLQGQIAKKLAADQALAAELEALLAEAKQAGYEINLTQTITGQGNVGAQIVGQGNTVIGGRRD